MNGKEAKACIFGGFILIGYALYLIGNPTSDGIIFGTVMGTIALIGGYAIRGMIEDGSR